MLSPPRFAVEIERAAQAMLDRAPPMQAPTSDGFAAVGGERDGHRVNAKIGHSVARKFHIVVGEKEAVRVR